MGAGVIASAFFAALRQLGDRRFLRVLFFGVALTVLLLAVLYAGLVVLLTSLLPDRLDLWWIGPVEGLHVFLGWGALGVMLIASAFLMVPVAAAFTGLFLDDVAQAVEDRHYPHLPPAKGADFWQGLRSSLTLLVLVLLANIALLIISPFAGPFAPLLYFGVNGYLLGREYFQSVALRREDAEATKDLGRRHVLRVWIAGVLMALPLVIPLVNLLVPVLATATFTHLYHRLKKGA